MADFESDTDDSDNEGKLSNICRQVLRPPGCSGKAKRGHLCFDAAFETGNLGRVDYVAEYDYDLYLRPDTSNPRHRMWFNFTVDNAKADQRAIFNLVNIHKRRNLFSIGMTPLIRSTSRPRWTRMAPDHVYYYKSDAYKGHFILSFAVCFDLEADVYQFALTFPYSYARLQAFLEVLEGRAERGEGAKFWRHTLAYSVQGRVCDILALTSSHNYNYHLRGLLEDITEGVQPVRGGKSAPSKAAHPPPPPTFAAPQDGEKEDKEEEEQKVVEEEEEEEEEEDDDGGGGETTTTTTTAGLGARKQRIVVIMARVHGGESPTSFIVQGMLEALTGTEHVADKLRRHVTFLIIPMLNPDGVYLGNYRSTLMGFDLNRAWGDANQWGHPTIHATKKLLLMLNEAPWCELDLILDLHAHSSLLGTFIYGNSYDDVYRHERHIVFPKMLSHACEDYCHYNTIYNRDPAKGQTARRWLCSHLKDSINVYTLYTSIYAYTNTKGAIVPYSEALYLRTGRRVVRGVLEYYQFLGLVPHAFPRALPLHDLPSGQGPGSPPLHARTVRHAAHPHPNPHQYHHHHVSARTQQQQQRGGSARGGARPRLPRWSPPSETPSEAGEEEEEEEEEDEEEEDGSTGGGEEGEGGGVGGGGASSGGEGTSEASGLTVTIQRRGAAPPLHHQRPTLPPARPRGAPREAPPEARRLPRATQVTLFPGPATPTPPPPRRGPAPHPAYARGLPDLPPLTASLPALRTPPAPRRRSRRRATAAPHAHARLAFRYYDFRRLTRPRRRPRARRAPNRSPRRRPRPRPRARARPRRPAPTPAPERAPPRRLAAGGGFNAARMADGGRGAARQGAAPPRGLRTIHVNHLTIGGRGAPHPPAWQAAPPRRPGPSSLPLLRRFLDPRAPLF
ncbi:cytosolic carboxypeptidase 6-like [Portunus trituberculatus]|uniref:cytosolic carboxypeptidase 6-like n=1 Tax=Portunus trituberculatus TaxID=210409 RepID=UPI001E1D1C53|nr:cytosolic carboxypeptidase 6-like [Portunus trituberculatus]